MVIPCSVRSPGAPGSGPCQLPGHCSDAVWPFSCSYWGVSLPRRAPGQVAPGPGRAAVVWGPRAGRKPGSRGVQYTPSMAHAAPSAPRLVTPRGSTVTCSGPWVGLAAERQELSVQNRAPFVRAMDGAAGGSRAAPRGCGPGAGSWNAPQPSDCYSLWPNHSCSPHARVISEHTRLCRAWSQAAGTQGGQVVGAACPGELVLEGSSGELGWLQRGGRLQDSSEGCLCWGGGQLRVGPHLLHGEGCPEGLIVWQLRKCRRLTSPALVSARHRAGLGPAPLPRTLGAVGALMFSEADGRNLSAPPLHGWGEDCAPSCRPRAGQGAPHIWGCWACSRSSFQLMRELR